MLKARPFQENCHLILRTLIILKPLVSLTICFVARSAEISVDTQTDSRIQTKYRNPRCACAPRVNQVHTTLFTSCTPSRCWRAPVYNRFVCTPTRDRRGTNAKSSNTRCACAFPWTKGSIKGTRIMQAIFKELCRPRSFCKCSLCDIEVSLRSSCLEHACEKHPIEMENPSFEHLTSLFIHVDSAASVFTLCKHLPYCSCLWTFKQK